MRVSVTDELLSECEGVAADRDDIRSPNLQDRRERPQLKASTILNSYTAIMGEARTRSRICATRLGELRSLDGVSNREGLLSPETSDLPTTYNGEWVRYVIPAGTFPSPWGCRRYLVCQGNASTCPKSRLQVLIPAPSRRNDTKTSWARVTIPTTSMLTNFLIVPIFRATASQLPTAYQRSLPLRYCLLLISKARILIPHQLQLQISRYLACRARLCSHVPQAGTCVRT